MWTQTSVVTPQTSRCVMPARLEDRVQVRGVERALARLVHDRLARSRLEAVHDVVAVLAAHQDAPHRPRIADAVVQLAAGLLRRRQVAQVGAVALTGVDDEHPELAGRLQHALGGRDGGTQQRDVVAQRLAEATGIDEVALHVDHQQRGRLQIELELVRLGLYGRHVSPRQAAWPDALSLAQPRCRRHGWSDRRAGRLVRDQVGAGPTGHRLLQVSRRRDDDLLSTPS